MRTLFANARFVFVLTLAFASLAIGADRSSADDALRWKFEVGEKLNFNVEQEMTISMDGGPVGKISSTIEQQMGMTWQVEGVNETGEAVIRQKIDRVQLTNTSPVGNFEYDSDSQEPPTGMAAMVAPMYDAMTKSDFEITITARGEVKDVKIPEEVLTALKNSPAAQQMGEMASAEGLKKMLTHGAFVLPEQMPEKGQSWSTKVELENPAAGKQTVTTTYTFDGIQDIDGVSYAVFRPELKIDFAGNDKLKLTVKDQSSDGEVLFDVKAGRLKSSKLKQGVTMDVSVAGQTMQQKIDQTINISMTPVADTSTTETEATETKPNESSDGATESVEAQDADK